MQPARQSNRFKYKIKFGKESLWNKDDNKIQIPSENVQLFDEFDFIDYSLDSTIDYLKEYFLTNFGHKYRYCKCELYVFFKNEKENSYRRLTEVDTNKLKDFFYDELYLIRVTIPCRCKYKKYLKYMNMKKFDIIKKLKETEDKLNEEIKGSKELGKEIERLNKENEIKNHSNPKFEDFYDIIIDINSIKKINSEGWKVIFNKKGLDNYKKYKEIGSITIGVVGNSNKGKSFLLSQISKQPLLSGASIQTKGLSVKYPELKEYENRQIILLDSAGFETPVLRNNNEENNIDKKDEIKEQKNEINNEKDEKQNNSEKNEEKIQANKEISDKEFKQNEEFKENARDKNLTEFFLQNFIIKESDIILLVVGKLTYSEQLLINKIKTEIKSDKSQKILIIHNLQEFSAKKQVEDYIRDTLLKCSTFNLIERPGINTKKTKEIKENKNDDKKFEPKIEDKKVNNNENPDNEKNLNINNEINNNLNENEDIKINPNSIQKEEININPIQNEEIKINNIQNEEIKINNIQNEDIKINNIQNEEIKINPIQKEEIKLNLEDFEYIKSKQEQEDKNFEKKIKIENKVAEPKDKNIIIDEIKKNEEDNKKDTELNNILYTEIVNKGKQNLEIYHLILSKEGSEAGKFYNPFAYDFIESLYNSIAKPEKFDVFDKIKENFKELSKEILNNDIKDFTFPENNKIIDEKNFKIKCNKELTLKRCYLDELGFSLFKTGNFEPKYNCFKEGNILEVRVEIPGNVIDCDSSFDVKGDETIITITGKKEKDSKPEELKNNIYNTRKFSKFELNIPLKVQEYNIIKKIENVKINKEKEKAKEEKEEDEEEDNFINGVFITQFELAQKKKYKKSKAKGL